MFSALGTFVLVVTPSLAADTAPSAVAVPACVAALPRVEARGRATISSTCGSKNQVIHDGDRVALGARGHLRLQADVDDRHSIDVICVGGAAPVSVTIGGAEAPWFTTDADTPCGPWVNNERVCSSAADEVLVCDAVARLRPATSARADRPLGLPTWFVGELPAAEDAAADAADADAAAGAAADEPARRRFTRIAVYQVNQVGLEDRLALVMTASLTAELRKLAGASVVGLDEVRTMLDLEAEKQATGCPDESCLAEIAAALGVDVLITAQVASVGGQHFVSIKRIDQREARVAGQVNQRLTAGNGDEFLAVVGPAVLALFPELALKPGRKRGVAPELAIRLNPPPLDPWMFWTGVSLTGASVVGTGVAGVVLWSSFSQYDALRSQPSAPGNQLKTLGADTAQWNTGLVVGAGVSAGLGVVTAASAAFVDWNGYRGDIQLENVQ